MLFGIVPPGAAHAQECDGTRYFDPLLFGVQQTNAVLFGSNTAVGGGDQPLYMDVYEPMGDQLEQRPVVIVAFGGSFIAGSRADVALICIQLARRGFVAIAPDYRTGLFLPDGQGTMLAVMRATHDLKAAVRYLRRSVVDLGDPWRIDPDRIIIGGVSAGAIGALHAAYLDQEDEMPPILQPIAPSIGGVEGFSGNEGYSSEVAGCFSLSGAIGDTAWIDAGDPPLLSIHETEDPLVPYFTQEVVIEGLATGLIASGGHDIHLRAEHVGVSNCLLTYQSDQHVGYLVNDATAAMDFIYDRSGELVCDNDAGCRGLIAGIHDRNNEPLIVYPDPADKRITVPISAPASITINDAAGRSVLALRLLPADPSIDVSHLPSGTYYVRIEGGPARAGRFVIAR